jgi:60 kDa SS-A/Ro ribonucleoprotein
MVKFTKSNPTIKTTNKEGGESFNGTDKQNLVQLVTTMFMGEPKFYGDIPDKTIKDLTNNISKTDPEFILKLAAFTRLEMHLRTVPIYLLVVAANTIECKPFVRKWTPMIINRADELYETVACHIQKYSDRPKNGKLRLPNSLKKGLAKAFGKFDEYALAKYSRKTDVTIKDVMSIVHPPRTELTQKIYEDKLATPYTWETELSTKGNKKEVWEKLIDSGRLPYMAMLRNINNMDKVEISEAHWIKVVHMIKNKQAVLKSKQLPFRFYSVIKNTYISDPFRFKELQSALSQALNHSIENLPKLTGKTFIATDSSGSMTFNYLSNKSKICCAEIGCLFAAMTNKMCDNAIIGLFDTNLNIYTGLETDTLTLTKHLIDNCNGGATNGYLTVKYLLDQKIFCDRMIMFTDMQLYGDNLQSKINKYRQTINPNFKVYIINLNGYGDICVNPQDTHNILISGWSDKILNYINMHEQGTNKMIKDIENYRT